MIEEVTEWRTKAIRDRTLSEADRRLAAELTDANRLAIEELRDGLRVRAQQWIGVVRLQNDLDLHVVPKLAGSTMRVLELIEYTRGLQALAAHSGVRDLDARGGTLIDLIGLLFIGECERIVRGGLLADYIEKEDEIPVLRGRLLVREQILRRLGRPELLICRYEERETDIFDNRLLAAGVDACARGVVDEEVRRRANVIRDLLGEACDVRALDLREAATASLSYDRLNAHYRDAHSLAQLLLQNAALEDLFAHGTTRSFVFLIDMNRLFEDFAVRLVGSILEELPIRVRPQPRDSSIILNADSRKRYATIIPDLLLERAGLVRRLAIDAKYKDYDERRISVGDITQTFLYAFAYGQEPDGPPPVALLFFPSSRHALSTTRLEVRSSPGVIGARIWALGLPVPRLLDELRSPEPGAMLQQLRLAITGAIDLSPAPEAA